ncbi:MAG: response regulator [Ruminococcus sp.]|nr:response regulator [Ruminococcus sp.]
MPLKLLVADDEDTIRKGVAKYIQLHTDRFQKIYEAENGKEAIEILLKYQPDIMLLDVQMPFKNGIDVMVEAEKAGLHTLTIILSGYDEFKYAQQALRYGAKDYLLKPTRAADILKRLNELADEYFGKEERNVSVNSQEQTHHFVSEAQEYIAEHYTENLVLADVAEKLGISGGYLSTLFNQELKCGFVDYLNQVRIERACCYLEQNYLKTYEIAYKVGFRDEKYFSRVFKKVKGMSPKEYRNMRR